MIDDKPFPLTLSIGISYDVGKNRDYLLSTAHNAMDYIRKNGGNGWQFFSPAMNEMVKERLVLGAALKEAISNNQLKLVYQPQIFAETGELYGIEALARWHDPQHGHVPLHGLFLSQKRLVKSKILGAGSSRKLAVS